MREKRRSRIDPLTLPEPDLQEQLPYTPGEPTEQEEKVNKRRRKIWDSWRRRNPSVRFVEIGVVNEVIDDEDYMTVAQKLG